jgi:hypothetical protein
MVVLQVLILKGGVVVSEIRRENRIIFMNGLIKVVAHASKSEMKQKREIKVEYVRQFAFSVSTQIEADSGFSQVV